jgi:hypothetical protein
MELMGCIFLIRPLQQDDLAYASKRFGMLSQLYDTEP